MPGEESLNPRWLDDSIQFPRLLAEISATQEIDFDALGESMDLDPDAINELFDRADRVWERAKAKLREEEA